MGVCYQGCLVAKSYAQIYRIDYSDTFPSLAKLTSIRLFLSMVATHKWLLHELDIKNAFLSSDLQEEVYVGAITKIKYVTFKNLCMVWNKVYVHGWQV